ncbi:Epidermal retinol dehydrogenase 2, partial [Eschrichtius robustus]|nr:Epidermal retinol dehydrogenase 2 [Eschrichtius robustus]
MGKGYRVVTASPGERFRTSGYSPPGVSQNMAPNLNSVKNLFVFLGKSVFALLEVMVFTFIPRPQKSVAGEIVLITGSGSGLGRLLALKFARLGSVLVLWDVSKEGNEETSKMAWEAGATKVYTYTCDCSRKEEVYRVADQVKKEVGDVSILINNAGIVTGKKFLDCPDELMEKSIDVNFKAHLWVPQESCPFLLPILEPEYAVRKIVDAILQEKPYLYMPRFMYFIVFLKSFLPLKVGMLLAEYMGIFNSMDGFSGHKKKD